MTALSAARKGYVYFVLSAFFYFLGNLSIKFASGYFSSSAVAFWRGCFGLVLLTAYCGLKGISLRGKNHPLLLLRGLSSGISIILFFYAMSKISFANATVLCYTNPIFAAVLGAMFLKEKLDLKTVALIITAFAGIILVLKPDFTGTGPGEAAGLLAGFFGGIGSAATRRLREKNESSFAVVFYFYIYSSLMALPLSYKGLMPDAPEAWLLICAIAVLITLALLFSISGYKYCSLATGSALSLLVVVFSYICGVLFLGEPSGLLSILGACLIVFANLFIIMKEKKIPAVE